MLLFLWFAVLSRVEVLRFLGDDTVLCKAFTLALKELIF